MTATACPFIHDYRRRNIAPDRKHAVSQGTLSLWLVGTRFAALVTLDDSRTYIAGEELYENTCPPQEIADDVMLWLKGSEAEIAAIKSGRLRNEIAKSLGSLGGKARAANLSPERLSEIARNAVQAREAKRYYSEWRGPANARLRSGEDLTLTVFGQPTLVRAFRHVDGSGECARIEFYRDGVLQDQATCFTEGKPKDKRFRYSE